MRYSKATLLRTVSLSCLLSGGCSDGAAPGTDSGAGPPDLGEIGLTIEAACDDDPAAVDAPQADLTVDKGAILACARAGDKSAEELDALLRSEHYAGPPLTSGAHLYRLTYRTERGAATPAAGYSSALVALPVHPRSERLPVVVFSHGSRGQCATCGASLMDPIDDAVNLDFHRPFFSLVGQGYAVIAPDLAGYAGFGQEGNPPSAYCGALDVAKSTLDGARALRNAIPSALTDDVVLVGLSQGGHTTEAAVAIADDYGLGGTLKAVVVYAPLWIPQRTWGGLLALPSLYPFAGSEGANAISIWYHYTHAELLFGPGHGVDPFQPAKQAAVKDFVEHHGWGDDGWAALHALGKDSSEVFDATFVSAVSSYAAGLSDSCPTDATQGPICETWKAIYADDRPHIGGAAATVPTLLVWGQKDTTIPADRITCAIDRLRGDNIPLTICVDPNEDHGGVVDDFGSYAADWIGAKVLGEPAPAACALDETAIQLDGQPAECAPIPPND